MDETEAAYPEWAILTLLENSKPQCSCESTMIFKARPLMYGRTRYAEYRCQKCGNVETRHVVENKAKDVFVSGDNKLRLADIVLKPEHFRQE